MKNLLARSVKYDTFDISGIIDKLTGYLDTAISYFEGLSPAVQKTILVVNRDWLPLQGLCWLVWVVFYNCADFNNGFGALNAMLAVNWSYSEQLF